MGERFELVVSANNVMLSFHEYALDS
ncbi:hypothetical protein DF3PA_190042 [Candidatus Defluviicoccus seviourii]|uniref:Uncharacterized protein n=1 Tax=Candidatus Defluviicoccus seviourii TaxID=2565273 RepID=A0A564WC77_9PROT|nr:hypothetical protein DF3PA_190042 [Candidatus Defluviicoccus seviourii]